MKVYHGSNSVVKNPNLNFSNIKSDFGKGFYTTTSYEQALKWTKIKKNRLIKQGINDSIKKYINVYEYEEDNNLSILNFDDATEEWLKFVFLNRESEELSHGYDIVKGPVANDNLYFVINNYERGVYNIDETISRLKTYLLSNQISFHTINALKCLKYIETLEIGDNDE